MNNQNHRGKCTLWALLVCAAQAIAAPSATSAPPQDRWTHGPPRDPSFFPIAVWLQNPANAERYRRAGINTYVGLWRGPTDSQLDALAQAGMKVFCAQNEVGLQRLSDSTIIGWMHDDEPDNAQSLPGGNGYGPPILPEKIVSDYQTVRSRDPSRPVLLNLGQGVAYDQYIGRGVRRGKLEDYPRYIEGCDIVSFDIYPVVHDKPEIAGQLWHVARGVERLIQWSDGREQGGSTYIFAVAMRAGDTAATFRLAFNSKSTEVEVIDEGRSLPLVDGRFSDNFSDWDVHLYRVTS